MIAHRGGWLGNWIFLFRQPAMEWFQTFFLQKYWISARLIVNWMYYCVFRVIDVCLRKTQLWSDNDASQGKDFQFFPLSVHIYEDLKIDNSLLFSICQCWGKIGIFNRYSSIENWILSGVYSVLLTQKLPWKLLEKSFCWNSFFKRWCHQSINCQEAPLPRKHGPSQNYNKLNQRQIKFQLSHSWDLANG